MIVPHTVSDLLIHWYTDAPIHLLTDILLCADIMKTDTLLYCFTDILMCTAQVHQAVGGGPQVAGGAGTPGESLENLCQCFKLKLCLENKSNLIIIQWQNCLRTIVICSSEFFLPSVFRVLNQHC